MALKVDAREKLEAALKELQHVEQKTRPGWNRVTHSVDQLEELRQMNEAAQAVCRAAQGLLQAGEEQFLNFTEREHRFLHRILEEAGRLPKEEGAEKPLSFEAPSPKTHALKEALDEAYKKAKQEAPPPEKPDGWTFLHPPSSMDLEAEALKPGFRAFVFPLGDIFGSTLHVGLQQGKPFLHLVLGSSGSMAFLPLHLLEDLKQALAAVQKRIRVGVPNPTAPMHPMEFE